jgi:hypothetical protein
MAAVPRPEAAQTLRVTGELSLLLAVQRIEPVYPVSNRGNGGYVVYTGEPFMVKVTLANESNATIRSSGSDGWLGALRIDFEGTGGEAGERAVPFETVALITRTAGGAVADPTVLSTNEVQEARLRLLTNQLPGPGTYVVSVALDRTRVSSSPSWPRMSLVGAAITVEIHSAKTASDRWNILYSRGVEARFSRRNGEARENLGKLLSENPSSVLGWYELGQTWLAEANCSQATALFQRVRDLIEARADPTERTARSGRQQLLETMQRDLAGRCGAGR